MCIHEYMYTCVLYAYIYIYIHINIYEYSSGSSRGARIKPPVHAGRARRLYTYACAALGLPHERTEDEQNIPRIRNATGAAKNHAAHTAYARALRDRVCGATRSMQRRLDGRGTLFGVLDGYSTGYSTGYSDGALDGVLEGVLEGALRGTRGAL